MKFSGFRCDRCGRFYQKNELVSDGRTLIAVGLIDLKNNLKRYELCDDCLNNVFRFLEEPVSGSEVRNEIE